MRNFRFLIFMVSVMLLICCKNKSKSNDYYPSGNAVKDYFHKKGFTYPFYCDSSKPICKIEDTVKLFGKLQSKRKMIARTACELIRKKYKVDSLMADTNYAFTVFPVSVYFIDSPKIWYRVIYKEYHNNTTGRMKGLDRWQLIDSNRIIASFRSLEFEVYRDDSLDFKWEQN